MEDPSSQGDGHPHAAPFRSRMVERLSQTRLIRLLLPDDHTLATLISAGLSPDQAGRIRREMTAWYLPYFMVTPAIFAMAMVGLNSAGGSFGDELSLAEFGMTMLLSVSYMAVGVLFVYLLRDSSTSVDRKAICGVIGCVDQLIAAQRRDPRLRVLDKWRPAFDRVLDPEVILRQDAWMVSGQLALLAGRRKVDRNTVPVNYFARWIYWAADDISDRRRVEGAMYACVDVIRYIFTTEGHSFPRLQSPPPDSKVEKPKRVRKRVRYIPVAVVVSVLSLLPPLLNILNKVME